MAKPRAGKSMRKRGKARARNDCDLYMEGCEFLYGSSMPHSSRGACAWFRGGPLPGWGNYCRKTICGRGGVVSTCL